MRTARTATTKVVSFISECRQVESFVQFLVKRLLICFVCIFLQNIVTEMGKVALLAVVPGHPRACFFQRYFLILCFDYFVFMLQQSNGHHNSMSCLGHYENRLDDILIQLSLAVF